MAFYGNEEYWDERYRASTNGPPSEWYRNYSSLRHLLNPIHFATKGTAPNLKPQEGSLTLAAGMKPASFPAREQCRVLILGCGNSTFGADMMRDGWTGRIVNVDFSKVVISQMKAKYDHGFYQDLYGNTHKKSSKTQMEFICADITQRLPFDDASFDLIVSKGSFDAVLCSAGSRSSIHNLVRECVRLLAPGHGIFCLVTNGNPDNRIEFLEYQNELNHYWQGVSVHTAPKKPASTAAASGADKTVYVYICRKNENDPGRPIASVKENAEENTADETANKATSTVV